ncbi:hypothetical protein CRUP_035092 [Coryphaenoides rupestris]|nr:hypothetical protein CRUP_035092 [Coryphaenoides rupestris]
MALSMETQLQSIFEDVVGCVRASRGQRRPPAARRPQAGFGIAGRAGGLLCLRPAGVDQSGLPAYVEAFLPLPVVRTER